MTNRPTTGAHDRIPECGARPLTGDLSCVLDTGHGGLHRNYQGIAYRAGRDLVAERLKAEAEVDGTPPPGRHRAFAAGGLVTPTTLEVALNAKLAAVVKAHGRELENVQKLSDQLDAALEDNRRLEAEIDRLRREPHLGVATTRHLIAELAARAEAAETWPGWHNADDVR